MDGFSLVLRPYLSVLARETGKFIFQADIFVILNKFRDSEGGMDVQRAVGSRSCQQKPQSAIQGENIIVSFSSVLKVKQSQDFISNYL